MGGMGQRGRNTTRLAYNACDSGERARSRCQSHVARSRRAPTGYIYEDSVVFFLHTQYVRQQYDSTASLYIEALNGYTPSDK